MKRRIPQSDCSISNPSLTLAGRRSVRALLFSPLFIHSTRTSSRSLREEREACLVSDHWPLHDKKSWRSTTQIERAAISSTRSLSPIETTGLLYPITTRFGKDYGKCFWKLGTGSFFSRNDEIFQVAAAMAASYCTPPPSPSSRPEKTGIQLMLAVQNVAVDNLGEALAQFDDGYLRAYHMKSQSRIDPNASTPYDIYEELPNYERWEHS